ncbi:hypothetical protein BJ508DRAFT_324821 [Ascobolus immersus RN42]|uniref:Uncharacterized protein n=1 Tax=Ascobolus immersus RN42 TaxID=1160509 RepID=A0A3N4ICR1_ASCIM|nr:hypothetical protein BJ508DRAFT_324821 [Ascobolus immersus RN42]
MSEGEGTSANYVFQVIIIEIDEHFRKRREVVSTHCFEKDAKRAMKKHIESNHKMFGLHVAEALGNTTKIMPVAWDEQRSNEWMLWLYVWNLDSARDADYDLKNPHERGVLDDNETEIVERKIMVQKIPVAVFGFSAFLNVEDYSLGNEMDDEETDEELMVPFPIYNVPGANKATSTKDSTPDAPTIAVPASPESLSTATALYDDKPTATVPIPDGSDEAQFLVPTSLSFVSNVSETASANETTPKEPAIALASESTASQWALDDTNRKHRFLLDSLPRYNSSEDRLEALQKYLLIVSKKETLEVKNACNDYNQAVSNMSEYRKQLNQDEAQATALAIDVMFKKHTYEQMLEEYTSERELKVDPEKEESDSQGDSDEEESD